LADLLSSVLVGSVIQAAEVVVAAAIGSVALKGYKATGSPTFLRLSVSFVLVAAGILVQGAAPYASEGFAESVVMILGSAVEAVGYFALALSHFFTVRQAITAVTGILVLAPQASEPALASLDIMVKAVSLYLLLYVSAETLIFFFEYKRRSTIISIIGLLLLTAGVLLKLFSTMFTGYANFFDLIKLAGLVVLLSPAGILLRRRKAVTTS
jgi:hypothetical protein